MADYTAPTPFGLGNVISLDAAVAVGAGVALEVEGSRSYALDVRSTGTPTAISVTLEGSLDGSNWETLGSAATAAGITWSVDTPVKFVRANLGTLTGGTTPTVTAVILAV